MERHDEEQIDLTPTIVDVADCRDDNAGVSPMLLPQYREPEV